MPREKLFRWCRCCTFLLHHPGQCSPREPLDFWLYHVSCLGGTFRQAYELSQHYAQNASIRQIIARETIAIHSVGRECLLLQLSENAIVASGCRFGSYIFFDKICEEVSPDCLVRIKGVVLDGTAAGILGKIPCFERPALNHPAPKTR